MKETEILKAVLQHWRALGCKDTLVASLPNAGAMGQYGLTKGLPDLLVLGPGLPVGFLELKTDRGVISEAQLKFQDHCERLNIRHAITHGRDEPIRVLEEWNIVRRVA